jgi:addiction module HigA family antidote
MHNFAAISPNFPEITGGRMHRMAQKPIHPGFILRDMLEKHELSMSDLADKINVPVNRPSQIINMKRRITADTAMRLGIFFGIAPEYFLDLQRDYDLAIAQIKHKAIYEKIKSKGRYMVKHRKCSW